MNNHKFYNLTPEEVERIKERNKDIKAHICSCGIQDSKPSFCQQGPLESSLMPECGFYFEDGVRKGECNRCGRCCALPRKDGSPYGFFDVLGQKCMFLIVEDL